MFNRALIAGAVVLAYASAAVAVDYNFTGSMSSVPSATDRWIAPATPAGRSVATGVRNILSLQIYSKASTGAWLKIYDTASTPTCGSGTPIKTIAIPAAATPANLAGNNPIFGLTGFGVTSGLGYCVTGDFPDNDTTAVTANTIVINTDYR